MRGLETILRVLCETRADDSIERGRRHRLDRRDWIRLFLHDVRDQRRPARAGEGLPARRHFVEHDTEGEDVRARIGFVPFELFGRHVLERPEDRPFLREVRAPHHRWQGCDIGSCHGMLPSRRLLPSGRVERPLECLRQTEVEELHSRLREHHVARLQVAVDDSLPVRLVERVRDLDSEAKHLLRRESSPGEAILERLPLEELHDEVLDPAFAPDVVERADMRVRKL